MMKSQCPKCFNIYLISYKKLCEGIVPSQSVAAIKKGIVSGSNVQQAKNQIPKPNGSK
jgi:hypothetical protein